jgi:hypothetical protein
MHMTNVNMKMVLAPFLKSKAVPQVKSSKIGVGRIRTCRIPHLDLSPLKESLITWNSGSSSGTQSYLPPLVKVCGLNWNLNLGTEVSFIKSSKRNTWF